MPETTMPFFQPCRFYKIIWSTLSNDLLSIDSSVSLSLSAVGDENLPGILLYLHRKFNRAINQNILMSIFETYYRIAETSGFALFL